MKKITKLPQSEHDIQNLLIDYLWKRGYYVQRMNSGRAILTGTKKQKYGKLEFEVPTERHVMLGDPGTPDIMAFRDVMATKSRMYVNGGKRIPSPGAVKGEGSFTELLFIEVKKSGNKPTQIQMAKMKQLEEYGARCIVATSLEDLQEAGI